MIGFSWCFFCALLFGSVFRPSPPKARADGRPVGVVFRGHHEGPRRKKRAGEGERLTDAEASTAEKAPENCPRRYYPLTARERAQPARLMAARRRRDGCVSKSLSPRVQRPQRSETKKPDAEPFASSALGVEAERRKLKRRSQARIRGGSLRFGEGRPSPLAARRRSLEKRSLPPPGVKLAGAVLSKTRWKFSCRNNGLARWSCPPARSSGIMENQRKGGRDVERAV